MGDGPRVAVVTGGSRGAGRGIAIALGEQGYCVYLTGRTEKPGQATLEGTIHDTAAQVTAAGGAGIAVRLDHRDDAAVEALFERVREEAGKLDILVNNAALLHPELHHDLPFWQKPLATDVDLLDVGLRSGLVAAYYAAPLLIEGGRGLIAFTSAPGAVHYQFGPGYGAHKAGTDKMATDMGVDFEPYGVAVVSIWMGAVLTEKVQRIIASGPERAYLADIGESPEFTGRIIAALYEDPKLMEKTGRTLIGAEEALLYGITDRDGRQPPSFRDLMKVEPANYRGRLQR
jgi:NAD(P)-dependent dehydrogenase (short-subunit alcohol dehydrogenase family)